MSENPRQSSRAVRLEAGAQAVINGALVTARTACEFEVGSGAYVLSGRALWRGKDALRSPHEALYFAMLQAGVDEARFAEERFRLFGLLSHIVTHDRTHAAQRECALCASALIAGDAKEAIASAARLASMPPADRRNAARVPGRSPKKRSSPVAQVYAHKPNAAEGRR